jgi:transposase-like protein
MMAERGIALSHTTILRWVSSVDILRFSVTRFTLR